VVLAYDFGKNLYAIFPSVGVERGVEEEFTEKK